MIRPRDYTLCLALLQKIGEKRYCFSLKNSWHHIHKTIPLTRRFSTNPLSNGAPFTLYRCTNHSPGRSKKILHQIWWDVESSFFEKVNSKTGCCRHFSAMQPDVSAQSHNDVEPKKSRAALVEETMKDLFIRPMAPSPEEWKEVFEKLTQSIPNSKRWPTVLIKIIASRCKSNPEQSNRGVALAKSLLEFTKLENNTPTIPSSVAFLIYYTNISGQHMAYTKTQDKASEAEIEELYSEIRKRAPLLDAESSAVVIATLCSTKSLWRESFDILSKVKEIYTLGSRHVVPVIAAAFREDCPDVAEELFDELARNLCRLDYSFTRVLDDSIVLEVLDKARRDGNSAVVDKLLRRMQEHQWLLSKAVTDQFIQYFKSIPGEKWSGRISSVSQEGVCRNCEKELASEELTQQQYEELRDSFLQICLLRENVFLNTSPEELTEFQNFLNRHPPFDIVLDGLNIGLRLNKKKKHQNASRLLEVVEDFSSKGRILVIGRKHMKNWSRPDMSRIKRLASIFYAENTSSDDPFMLYAALHSGPHALVVTCDMFRNHRFLLPHHLRDNFNAWQRTHQVTFSTGNELLYNWPSSHDTRAQWTQDGLHVPFDDQSERASHELPNSWICLERHQ